MLASKQAQHFIFYFKSQLLSQKLLLEFSPKLCCPINKNIKLLISADN